MDGLRLVAALMVVGYHYLALSSAWGHNPATIFPTLHPFAQFGWLGVEVFFLVSGFVICMSVWGRTIGDFAVSRVSRLFPAYWVAIPLTALVVKKWPEISSIRHWDDVIVNFTMLQAGNGTKDVDGAYWTLFVEIKFYILMAIVVLCGVTYRNVLVFCGVWTVAAALAPGLGTPVLVAFAMPQYAPFFIAGIAFYLMRRYGSNPVLWGLVVFQFLLAQRYIRYRMASNLGHAAAENLPTWPVRLVILAGFLMVGAIALGVFNKVQWKWLSTAGALTYPLYLIHMFIGLTLIHHFRGRVAAPVLVVSVVALMMATAWLIHRFVERPASRWIRDALKRGIADVRDNTPVSRRRRAGGGGQPTVPPATPSEFDSGVPVFLGSEQRRVH
ncbi:acyltransferase [Streptomyces sp. ASQP_92]|uniref:acyltransferase family protein n=1 Tax=Streptomyces sp. ASQP_92 TaxID=2979116 RepID=UPI0021C149E2|nr:acyltransferase [Streptomyces sp. ASQP_92]MCT9089137.1 acyltransferase [Streptomyces sp. ASQP_92]